jgi:murein DD-endopeptidase MepM/ murein hydrolase activator NlpD
MLTTQQLWRAAAPCLLTGLLTTSALAVATPASARDQPPQPPAAHSASQGAPAATKGTTTQPIVPGETLRAKPAPWVLPVVGYHLTGRFGDVSGLWQHFHTGLDFAAPTGTEIRSIAPGVVVSTAYDGAFGNKTVVRLDDGTVLWYCHQNEFGVRPGQHVRPGDLIGYVGSTGNTTGPHLHLEVHPGGGPAVDPELWLPKHGLHP